MFIFLSFLSTFWDSSSNFSPGTQLWVIFQWNSYSSWPLMCIFIFLPAARCFFPFSSFFNLYLCLHLGWFSSCPSLTKSVTPCIPYKNIVDRYSYRYTDIKLSLYLYFYGVLKHYRNKWEIKWLTWIFIHNTHITGKILTLLSFK